MGKIGRTSYRRFAGVATGLGAVAIAAVFVLSSAASAGVAHPASAFPGAYWFPSTYRDSEGCGQAHAYPAHWSAVTGDGKVRGASSAKTCPAYRGGNAVYSSGDVDQELGIVAWATVPTSGAGGINVSWNIKGSASETSVYTVTSCPTVWSNYTYNYGTYIYHSNYRYADCEVESGFDLEAYGYLYDHNNGTEIGFGDWYQDNESFAYNDTYNDSYGYNYTASSEWIYNSSYSYGGSYNYSYGSPASWSGTVTPTWFFNYTYNSADTYEFEGYFYADQYNYVDGWTGHSATSVNFGSGSNHVDLLPFSIW